MKKIPLTNRNFELPADGWFHISPMGDFDHSSGVLQVVDATAATSMTNRFREEAAAPGFAGMLIDFDHFSHDPDKSSAAAGWITALQNRDTGLWAQIRWSDLGEAAVKGGRYRFVSPVWNRSDCEELGSDKVRPLRLARVALTNDPNLQGLTPLTNRNTLPDDPANAPAGTDADIQNKETHTMKKIAPMLGLSADASEEAIVGELTKLVNRATTAEAALAPLTAERDSLQNRVNQAESNQAEADLDAAGIAKDNADRPKIKTMLIANRDAGLALLKLVKAPAAVTPARTPLTNRTTAKTPATVTSDGEPTAEDQAKAARISNRAHEIQKTQGLSWSAAFNKAQLEANK